MVGSGCKFFKVRVGERDTGLLVPGGVRNKSVVEGWKEIEMRDGAFIRQSGTRKAEKRKGVRSYGDLGQGNWGMVLIDEVQQDPR